MKRARTEAELRTILAGLGFDRLTRELASLLREYMTEFPAFRGKPEGSPFSDARKAQKADIQREDRARAALGQAGAL